jgi:DNA-binding transcriptional ArsR family regulator
LNFVSIVIMINRMVEHRQTDLDGIFRALGDSTRRAMLRQLVAGESTVTALAEPHRMSLAAASKHIRVLERAGLVHRNVVGREHRCRLVAGQLAAAHRWLEFYRRFWSARLDALERELRGADRSEHASPAAAKRRRK